MGTPFKELYAFLPPASRLANGTNNLGIGERESADDGMIGYYPAVSCFGGGAVECRFEPPWWIGPPSHTDTGEPIRAIGERFNEQIAEDVLADIVDEVEAMSIWGGVDGNVVGAGELNGSGSGIVGGSAILKEGVGAAYDSSTPADGRTANSTGNENTISNEAASLPDMVSGHTTFEDALGTEGTPNAEASSVTGFEGTVADEDTPIS